MARAQKPAPGSRASSPAGGPWRARSRRSWKRMAASRQAVARLESSSVTSRTRARRRSRSAMRTTSRARTRRSSRWRPATSSRVEPPGGPGQQPAQIRLGAGAAEPARAGGPAEQARVAGQQRREHAGGAAEQQQGVEQVRLRRQLPGAVQEPLQAGQAEVRVRGPLHLRQQRVQVGDPLRQPGQPLRRLRGGGGVRRKPGDAVDGGRGEHTDIIGRKAADGARPGVGAAPPARNGGGERER